MDETNRQPLSPYAEPVPTSRPANYTPGQTSYPATYVSTPAPSTYYSESSTYASTAADDYVYYPSAEVYYSPSRRIYFYNDHDRWVTRSEAPRYLDRDAVSVHIQLRDGPENHHAEILRTYPHNWRPQHDDRDHPNRHDRDDDDANRR